MKRIHTYIIASVAIFVMILVGGVFSAPPAFAEACPAGQAKLASNDKVCCPSGSENDVTNCMVAKYVNPAIVVLSAVAGVAVIGGIIWGAIQYGTSAGDPQKVTKGKRSITQALVGLVAFLLLGSFIQFLSPYNVTTTSGMSCDRQFLGLKKWYAYIPKDQINPDTCIVSQDLPLLPTATSKGVLPAVALAIVDDLLMITAYVSVAFVLTGGIQYITSQGAPEMTKRAMSTILNALIALAVALIAKAIVSFIGKALTS